MVYPPVVAMVLIGYPDTYRINGKLSEIIKKAIKSRKKGPSYIILTAESVGKCSSQFRHLYVEPEFHR